MALANSHETKEFLTCPICFCLYNEGTCKPKLLPCSHTLCQECVNKMMGVPAGQAKPDGVRLPCPICRKACKFSGSSLPDNTFALQLLKVYQTKSAPQEAGPSKLTIKDLGTMLKELDKMKKLSHSKLLEASSKRKEAQHQLQQIRAQISKVFVEVMAISKDNERKQSEIDAQLASASAPEGKKASTRKSSKEKEPPFLSELMSLTNDSKPDDTLFSLREKLKKRVAQSEAHLEEAEKLVGRIAARDTDEETNAVRVSIGGRSLPVEKSGLLCFLAYSLLEEEEDESSLEPLDENAGSSSQVSPILEQAHSPVLSSSLEEEMDSS